MYSKFKRLVKRGFKTPKKSDDMTSESQKIDQLDVKQKVIDTKLNEDVLKAFVSNLVVAHNLKLSGLYVKPVIAFIML